MKKGRRLFFLLFLSAGIFSADMNAFAQNDTLRPDTSALIKSEIPYVRPSVEIIEFRVKFLNPGMISQHIDSLTKSHNEAGSIADLFNEQGVFLKSYGSGELATPAVRGAAASQTAVLWNGIDLRSTTNGIADLSIIPSILFNEVSVANGAFVNSIGGHINLASLPQFCDYQKSLHVKIAEQMGSFGKVDNGARLEFRSTRFAFGLTGYYQHATNNFTYHDLNRAGAPVDTLKNANVITKGFASDANCRTKNARNYFRLHSWFSDSYRQIPPTMLETVSEQTQTDRFWRNSAEYDYYRSHSSFYVRSSLLTEYLLFDPGFLQEKSTTNSVSSQNACGLRYSVNNLDLGLDLGQSWAQAEVSQYMPLTTQMRYYISANSEYVFKHNINVSVLVRQEFLGNTNEPVTGSAGCSWYVSSNFILHLTVGRKYRIPTFNDLYWNPGGNPDLKPEDSRNVDGGIVLSMEKDHWSITYALNSYYRYVYNWIQWQPGPGYWIPKNLYEVQTYGAEHRVNLEWKKSKWDNILRFGMDYVRATNQQATIAGDSSIGKQLIYLPAYKFNIMLHFTYNEFYVEANDNFTGLRYTSTDHSTYLPSYNVIDFIVGKRLAILGEYSDVFLRCNNLLNRDYQAIAWRPMPGRNFECGITINFNQPFKSKIQSQ